MNRFSKNADSPRRGYPRWNDAHHLSPSRINHKMSIHYKELFAKRSGRDEKDRDPINYPLRTAYDGKRRKSNREASIKHWFSQRIPL